MKEQNNNKSFFKKHPKKILFLGTPLFMIILILAGILGYFLIERRAIIVEMIPVDINNDGTDELIVAYEAPYIFNSQPGSIVEAHDLKNDAVLWKTTTDPVYSNYFKPEMKQNSINSGKNLFLFTSVQSPDEWAGPEHNMILDVRTISLQALSLENGSPVWQYTFEKEFVKIKTDIFLHKGKLISVMKKRKKESSDSNGFLFIFDEKTGKRLLKQQLSFSSSNSLLHAPFMIKDDLVIHTFEDITLANILTNKISVIPLGNSRYNYGLLQEKNRYIFTKASGGLQLFELDIEKKNSRPLIINGKPASIMEHTDSHPMNCEKLYLASFEEDKRFTVTLPKSFCLFTPYSIFENNDSDYIPLFLYHINYQKDGKGFSTDNSTKRLCILHENKKITWESKDIIQYGYVAMLNPNMFFKNGLYPITIGVEVDKDQPRSKNRFFLAILDGKNGTFKGVYDLGKDRSSHFSWYKLINKPSLMKNNILYGALENEFWAIDLKTMKNAYPDSKAVSLPSSPGELEKVVGKKLP
ncbi:MAG: PQQ-like beta-propeller repeat protein [bacterium]|nr:PQQ-like beta-propeller repeat protein [bacterium]